MAAPVPPDRLYYISSFGQPNRVAELPEGSPATGVNIIGFAKLGGKNQQWLLKYKGQSVYTFQCQYGSQPYAHTTGNEVKGNAQASEYILERVEGTKDHFKIIDKADSQKGWTLTSLQLNTHVTLGPDDGRDDQRWIFQTVT